MSFQIRFIIGMLGAYACALVYMHRASISIAVVAMTKNSTILLDGRMEHNLNNVSTNLSNISSILHSFNDTNIYQKPEFEWDDTLQGIILGAQFYMYIFVPTMAGRATDAIGGKWIAFFGALGPCILAAVTPVITKTWGAPGLIVNRIIVGAFHGFTYPAMFSLFIKWFPMKELAIANGGLVFGGSLGSTIMSVLAGYIAQYLSWHWIFYVLALFHVPFLLLWFYLSTNEPRTNRHISESERKYIEQNVQEKVISKKAKIPWLKMIFSLPVICSLITKMCCGFCYFLLITKMPSYLVNVFNIDLFNNGWIYAGTNLANGLTCLIAPSIANILIIKLKWPRLVVRKLFQSLSVFGPALCLGLIPAMELRSNPVIILLITAMMLYGLFTAGEWTIVSEYAPNFAGTVFGFGNILAFAMGVFAPYIVGVLLDNKSKTNRQQWNKIFYMSTGIYIVGGLTFLLCATDQQQSWDRDAVLGVVEDNKNIHNHHEMKVKKKLSNNDNVDDNKIL